MGLAVLEMAQAGDVRACIVRLDGETRALLAQCVGGREDLWLTCAIGPLGFVRGEMAVMLEPDSVAAHDESVTVAEELDHGLALYGAPWGELTPRLMRVQHGMFAKQPGWLDDVPTEQVWALREFVPGSRPGRIERALDACRAAYVAEGPAGEGWRR